MLDGFLLLDLHNLKDITTFLELSPGQTVHKHIHNSGTSTNA
jgi:hypothetical protein